MRSTELNAVIGLNQLKRLDSNNKKRQENFKFFLESLDKNKYYTDYDTNGSVNYAFVLILRDKNVKLFDGIVKELYNKKVEFRRGTAGGGNMARQPFVKKALPNLNPLIFTNAEHVHFYGLYTGNYPSLEQEKISELCSILNKI
jgi:CDP-6-deoxy-D-xylo-4-hexulose-3-dehydrase